MNRALIIAVLGAIVLTAALLLNFYLGREDATKVAAPAAPAPTVVVPPAEGQANPVAPDIKARTGNELSFDIVRVNPEGNAVVAGRAPPGSEVTVLDGEKVVGKVTADKRGEWVLVPEKPLQPGARNLSLSARTEDGKTINSGAEVVLVVPKRGKNIAGGSAKEGLGALALRVPRHNGEGGKVAPSTVLQSPGGGGTGPGAKEADKGLSIEVIDYDSDGHVTISGTADSGAPVRIYVDNKPAGAARANDAGRWVFSLKKALPPGDYSLRVDELTSGGRVARRIEVRFSRAPALGDLGERQIVVVQPGNSLWRIARRAYGSGTQYFQIYEANKSQIRDPNLIYPGQVFTVPHDFPRQSN